MRIRRMRGSIHRCVGMPSRTMQIASLVDNLHALLGDGAEKEAGKRLADAISRGAEREVNMWFEVWAALAPPRAR